MSPQPKKRQPLTAEQQATVVQWRPLACKYVLKSLHGLGLGHFEDEAEGLAADALMGAVRVWDPRRGAFASCLKWWVRATVRVFRAHGARVVHQAEDTREFLPAFSLNAPLKGDSQGVLTWEERLLDDSLGDPSEAVDAARLLRAAEVILTGRLEAESDGHVSREMAEAFYRVWFDREVDGDDTPMHLIGWAWGVSRQRAHQRLDRVRAGFEEWARDIREEAA